MASTKTESVKTQIDVRQAANASINYFRRLFPGVAKYSLEEVEMSEDENYWLITLGFETQVANSGIPANMQDMFGTPKTKYKIFKVDIHTGQVLAMKIRSIK